MRPVSDGDRELLRAIVARRQSGLLERVDQVGRQPLPPETLEELRGAVIDEACETPDTAEGARRILELEELLAGITETPQRAAGSRPPR